jgi:hypothetical protein
VVAAIVVVRAARKRPRVAAPLVSGFTIAALVVGGYLAATTLRDA